MGKKYCCVPLCHNTSDSVDENGNKIIMRRFPIGEKRRTIRAQWIARVKTVRANLKVNDNTRICSQHFKEPYNELSVPTVFPSKPLKPQVTRRPLVRHDLNCSNDNEKNVTCDEHSVMHCEDEVHNVTTESDNGENINPQQSEKICLQHASTQAGEPKVKDMKDSSVESKLPFMSYEDIMHDDNKIRFYTGFLSSSMFWLFFSTLMKHGADRLSYWEGNSRSLGEKTYHVNNSAKPGRQRKLRPVDEFLMVTMRLRQGMLQEHLADLFRVSLSSVSRIMNTWINFIYDHCKSLVCWPTREQILCNLPQAFQDYPDVRIILDCTEFYTEKPSSLSAQWATWSEYKHSNTFKVLIGVAPNGLVTFVSRLWGGNTSDRHITMHDSLLPKLSAGDVIMADKGFTVEDLLPADVGLNIPPRIPGHRQMTTHEFFQTQGIASARIVVEMKMEQIKNYRILNGTLPLSEAHLAEQMVFICTALTNLLPPLLT
uniref:Uncharacterized protein LOC111111416 n=1 Tax=Crassostrea virginica TaxID=6565 RepID=A0A8B8CA14_CRAVI|nr:uncharacterized protein LOC111111416 [Crassostrea virginica]XP_022312597.1 uncharacterized protein LOC111117720 [Crassostrea virginica]